MAQYSERLFAGLEMAHTCSDIEDVHSRLQMVFEQLETDGVHVRGRNGGIVADGHRVVHVRRLPGRNEEASVDLLHGIGYLPRLDPPILSQRIHQILVAWHSSAPHMLHSITFVCISTEIGAIG